MMHARQRFGPWPVIAGAATLVVVAAVLSMWLVVWRAPRDLPVNATEFWIDYVVPRAAVTFGALAPTLALVVALAWVAISKASGRGDAPESTADGLFSSRVLAALHLVAIANLAVAFIAIAALAVTRSQSSVGPIAVFVPGVLAVLVEGQVVERVARARAARLGAPMWLERISAQRELLSVSAAIKALRVVRGSSPPDSL